MNRLLFGFSPYNKSPLCAVLRKRGKLKIYIYAGRLAAKKTLRCRKMASKVRKQISESSPPQTSRPDIHSIYTRYTLVTGAPYSKTIRLVTVPFRTVFSIFVSNSRFNLRLEFTFQFALIHVPKNSNSLIH